MRLQFSLRELMASVVFVAVGCAGLLHPSPYLASAVFTLMVMALIVGVLAAVGRTASARFFWIGFCIAGWGYLWIAHWPDEQSYSALPQWELQTNGPLLTTKLLRLACDALHPEPDSIGDGFFSVPRTDASGSFDGGLGLPLAQFGTPIRPERTGPPYEVVLDAFMRIGHSLWTLLFAYLGGRLTRHLHDARKVVTVHGDCPDFRGEVRENGTVPLCVQGDRHIFRPETGRKMSQSPPCERLRKVPPGGKAP